MSEARTSTAEVEALQRADTIDAEALFRLHASFVARFLVRLGVAPSEIEDLVQDVFLTVHRLGGFVPGAARPTTWLADIALRLVANHRRGLKRRGDRPDTDAVELAASEAPDAFRAAATVEGLDRAQRVLDGLSLDQRAVFVLYELEEQSCESIAAGMNVPIGTVYSRLHAARRAFIEAYRVEEEGKRP